MSSSVPDSGSGPGIGSGAAPVRQGPAGLETSETAAKAMPDQPVQRGPSAQAASATVAVVIPRMKRVLPVQPGLIVAPLVVALGEGRSKIGAPGSGVGREQPGNLASVGPVVQRG